MCLHKCKAAKGEGGLQDVIDSLGIRPEVNVWADVDHVSWIKKGFQQLGPHDKVVGKCGSYDYVHNPHLRCYGHVDPSIELYTMGRPI